MIRASMLVAGVLLAQVALAGNRATPAPAAATPASDEALLRDLESRYEQCMDAARRGDMEAYLRLRTDASRNRPPALDADRIRLLAGLLPPLSTLEFVRLDANDKTARALYRWRKADVAQYSVLVYRVERGEWKLDDFSVRRSTANTAQATADRPPAPARVPGIGEAAALRDTDMPSESQAILRNWQSGRPDPSRQLDAPRL
jgi:hypothetical protein